MEHLLSKSTFVKGNQCTKALYLYKYQKHLMDEIDEAQQAVFDQGTDIGLLAQQLFPGGVDLSPEEYWNFGPSVKQTQAEITKGTRVIYEAAFIFDGTLSALDILMKEKKGYTAYEVKSSSSEVTDAYKMDAALQYYVMVNSGVKVNDFFIVNLNREYTRKGALDVKQLFKMTSVLEDIKLLQPGVEKKIGELKEVLKDKQVPAIKIGPHCGTPYPCLFKGHCWKHIPEYSVFDLSNVRDKAWKLYNKGILRFEQLDAALQEEYLNASQLIEVIAEVEKKTIVDKPNLKSFLASLEFPLHFMDFESMQPAVPLFDNSNPYQQVSTQYSMHQQKDKNSGYEHFEFLAETNGKDPREPFIKSLIKDCGVKGSIIVYSHFEKTMLNRLAKDFPKYAKALNAIVGRLVDLASPFQKKWYYTREMQGSYSIKSVLPALVPELSYSDLPINNGTDAKNIFGAMFAGTYKGDVQKARGDLLEYCKLDTWAMVRIYEKLKTV
jgi:hypothetical protein